MNEILTTLETVWMNLILGGRLTTFIYGVISFLLFYHWFLNKLIKRNYSAVKASLIFLLVLVAYQSLLFFLERSYRAPSVKANDLYFFIVRISKVCIAVCTYSCFNYFILKQENRQNNLLRIVIVFFLFAFYLSPIALITKSSLDYNFESYEILRVIVCVLVATGLEVIIGNIFKNQELKEQKEKLEKLILSEQVMKAQYEILQAKVNPHFLYNSLNSIAGLASVDAEKTKKMALSLSNFFKYSINRESKNVATIAEEIKIINTYLEIEKIRFGDRLRYSISVDEMTENIEIPKFLLQPLVENSVKHGRSKNDGSLDIELVTKLSDNKLKISVTDRGIPFDEDIKPGYGIKSVYDKLDLAYPDGYEISFVNSPEKSIDIVIEL